MLKITLVALGAALAASSVAEAANEDPILVRLDQEIARWEVQKIAAERDVELVNTVQTALAMATSASDGKADPASVNAALLPLVERYPDYRLKYRDDGDFCRVQRGIDAARGAALSRIVEAINNEQKAMLLKQVRLGIERDELLGGITGRTDETLAADMSFIQALDLIAQQTPVTDWSGMDYFTVAPPDPDCG